MADSYWSKRRRVEANVALHLAGIAAETAGTAIFNSYHPSEMNDDILMLQTCVTPESSSCPVDSVMHCPIYASRCRICFPLTKTAIEIMHLRVSPLLIHHMNWSSFYMMLVYNVDLSSSVDQVASLSGVFSLMHNSGFHPFEFEQFSGWQVVKVNVVEHC